MKHEQQLWAEAILLSIMQYIRQTAMKYRLASTNHNSGSGAARIGKVPLLALMLFGILLLAQCSSETVVPTATPVPATATATAAPTPTSTSGPTATPFATATAVPSPTAFVAPEGSDQGGILRLAVPSGPPHMDPHLTVAAGLLSWGAGQVYSRLFKFEGSGDNPTIACDLCASWEQTAPLTFSIELRDDVYWQNLSPLNGRKLTAQDVAYSLNRQSTPGFPNSALLSNIAEITAIGERNILIRLSSPDSETLEKLADSHSRIVAREAVEVNGDLRRGPTVGSGPWVASVVQGDRTELFANQDYYNDDLPYLDGIDIQVIPAASTRVAGTRTKIIDLTQASFDLVDEARKRFPEIGWFATENPAAGVEIMMNTARSPLNKQAVREAMMLTWQPGTPPAIPGESSMFEVYDALPGVSLGLPLMNQDWLLPTSNYLTRFDDVEKANKLLASAEIKPTDNVVIKVGEYGQQYIDQATAMAEGLASVGIRAEVERVSTRNFGDEVWTTGDYDIAVGAPPPVASTTAYLFAVHHSEGPWNTTGYANAEVDRLIEAQAREYDPVKRGELLVELQKQILSGSHRFIGATRQSHWMFWDYVHDFQPYTPRGDTDFFLKVWLTDRAG
jgi:peptide/nickel transport system substrate-binding protein